MYWNIFISTIQNILGIAIGKMRRSIALKHQKKIFSQCSCRSRRPADKNDKPFFSHLPDEDAAVKMWNLLENCYAGDTEHPKMLSKNIFFTAYIQYLIILCDKCQSKLVINSQEEFATLFNPPISDKALQYLQV